MSDKIKIDLKKLTELWNPFEQCIWIKIKTPITQKEIAHAIDKKWFRSPNAKKDEYLIWDTSLRHIHIKRIAWLVKNFDLNYPIEIDFGLSDGDLCISDGNHRLAAAIYLNKLYIYVNASGAEDLIEKFIF